MLPADGVVSELTRLVWSSMLGLEAEQRAAANVPFEVAATVDIVGAWEGTVSIALSMDVATHFAATMLGRTEASLSAVEVRDVIGELAHVMGGNVKSAMPGPSSVSMPRIAAATEPPPADTDASYWFECEGQPFCVTVHEGPRSGS